MEDGTTVMNAVIPDRARGERLDKVLASVFPPYSRSQLQLWIRQGRITIHGRIPHGRELVSGGEAVRLEVPRPEPVAWQPQDLPLELVYEDADILVIDKPAGVVVHPGAGNPDGTLANAILYHFPELAALPRAGLVHRIDKGTTGLLVAARNEHARSKLIRALECHAVSRCYLAVVDGIPISGGTLDQPIGRHPRNRLRMAVNPNGKPAVTHYRVEEKFRAHALLSVELETGRTHQIRVHLSKAGYPLVGDVLYGRRLRIPAGASGKFAEMLRGFKRQALHARSLTLTHPRTGKSLNWKSPVPPDLAQLLSTLRSEQRSDP